jgi:TPR repeat protein
MNNLAACLLYGDGVARNERKAFELFLKAAEIGDVLAQYNLGQCFDRGIGIERNEDYAVYWLTKAAEQGDSDAEKTLKLILLRNSK